MKYFTTKRDKIEEGIQYEELAKTSDNHKFMLKAYPELLLKGDKISEPTYLYAVGMISGYVISHSGEHLLDILAHEINCKRQQLIEKFNEVLNSGEQVIESHNVTEYDENGKEIQFEPFVSHNKVISKRVEVTTKTTYFLSDKKKFKIQKVPFYPQELL